MSEEEIIIQLAPHQEARKLGIGKVIWRELTAGVGVWGSMRPLVAIILAAVPLLFLGQHFNREHQKAVDWTLIQVPLPFTVILWIGLWGWSIVDAWQVANAKVVKKRNKHLGIGL